MASTPGRRRLTTPAVADAPADRLHPVAAGPPVSPRRASRSEGPEVPVSQPQDGAELVALHEALADVDGQDLDQRFALLRSVEAGISHALEGLDGL